MGLTFELILIVYFLLHSYTPTHTHTHTHTHTYTHTQVDLINHKHTLLSLAEGLTGTMERQDKKHQIFALRKKLRNKNLSEEVRVKFESIIKKLSLELGVSLDGSDPPSSPDFHGNNSGDLCHSWPHFDETFMISSLTGDGIDSLKVKQGAGSLLCPPLYSLSPLCFLCPPLYSLSALCSLCPPLYSLSPLCPPLCSLSPLCPPLCSLSPLCPPLCSLSPLCPPLCSLSPLCPPLCSLSPLCPPLCSLSPLCPPLCSLSPLCPPLCSLSPLK